MQYATSIENIQNYLVFNKLENFCDQRCNIELEENKKGSISIFYQRG